MIFNHEHQHPPSTATPSVDRFTMVMAKTAVGASLIGVALLLVQSLARGLW